MKSKDKKILKDNECSVVKKIIIGNGIILIIGIGAYVVLFALLLML